MKSLFAHLVDRNNDNICVESYIPSKVINIFKDPDSLKQNLLTMKEYADRGNDIRYFYSDVPHGEIFLWKDLYKLITDDKFGIIKINADEGGINDLKFKKGILYKFDITSKRLLRLLSDDLDPTKIKYGIFIQDDITRDIYLVFINKTIGFVSKLKNIFNEDLLIDILKKLTTCKN